MTSPDQFRTQCLKTPQLGAVHYFEVVDYVVSPSLRPVPHGMQRHKMQQPVRDDEQPFDSASDKQAIYPLILVATLSHDFVVQLTQQLIHRLEIIRLCFRHVTAPSMRSHAA